MSNLLNIKDQNGNWIPIPIATNGIASIIQNSDYTLTITLEDGTVYTTTSIKGDAFTYSDFTPEQLASLKGEKGDKGDQGIQGEKGDKGDTGIQGVQGERGKKGDTGAQGIQGEKGDKGDAFTYADFTPEQLASLKGDKGDKGDAFEYSDFTPQQLASLKGEKGDKGDQGDDYILTQQDKEDIAGLVDIPVDDVQINGISIVNNGVANIPVANGSVIGVVKGGNGGTGVIVSNGGYIYTVKATSSGVKDGLDEYRPIVPQRQHESAFYGLAKAAGDSTQSASSNAVGTYTPEALVAIQKMLGVYQAPFRTIKEITITEETKTVYVNSDSNNEPFSLSEMIVIIQAVATNNGGIGFFVINNGAVKLTSAELTTKPFVSAANIFYTTERAHAIHMWIAGNRFFGETMDNIGNNGYTMVNKQATRQSMGFCECNAITELFIYSPNDYKFTSGTITIIGR